MKMDKEEIKLLVRQKERIEQLVNGHSERLNEFPKLPNGLMSDEVRNSDFYKFHKEQYDKHFEELRNFNGRLTNKQKMELLKYKKKRMKNV